MVARTRDPFDENEEGKQYQYRIKNLEAPISHRNKDFDMWEVSRKQWDRDGGELLPMTVNQFGFTDDGKEMVIPLADNKKDLARDKKGQPRPKEEGKAAGDSSKLAKFKGPFRALKEKAKSKIEAHIGPADAAAKVIGPEYDKASQAELVKASFTKAGKDLSNLEKVHIKDINEEDTLPKIKQVKEGREDQDTVLDRNRTPEDFETIYNSVWGKSVQKTSKAAGKEVESITIPPTTGPGEGYNLEFKLVDQSARGRS
ncbi:unnamed protein product [Clonostachys rosea]|uniref:Uncharacterized protein n=1 Tax=Bionectria ochroleuca TaxID=29856 RepID=A0ABY6UM71_BIOOC|nr:unnamed protein product [Clonostachys rosea]